MKRKKVTDKKYYKIKLNMLEPGIIMMKMIGVLVVISIIFGLIKWHMLSNITLFAAGAIFVVLLVLVAIEGHQDRVQMK